MMRSVETTMELTFLQMRILLFLSEVDGEQREVSPSALASNLVVSRTHICNSLKDLQKRGLLRRTFSAPAKRAAKESGRKFYAITPGGYALLTELQAQIQSIDNNLFALSSRQAARGIEQLAQKLINAHKLDLLGDPMTLSQKIKAGKLRAGRQRYQDLYL